MEKYNPAPPGSRLQRWRGILSTRWPLLAMGALAVVSWIPYFGAPRCPKNYIQTYGMQSDRAFVIVDTSDLINDRPKRLMLIARPSNHAVDTKMDTDIVRSATFEIAGSPMRLDVFITPEFILNVNKVGLMEEYLLETPSDIPIEAIHSLGDAEKRGAKILDSKASGGSTVH